MVEKYQEGACQKCKGEMPFPHKIGGIQVCYDCFTKLLHKSTKMRCKSCGETIRFDTETGDLYCRKCWHRQKFKAVIEKEPEKIILQAPEEAEKVVPAPKLKPAQIQSMVYGYIVKHRGEIDIEKCAEELGIPEANVEMAIEVMKAKGELEAEGEKERTKAKKKAKRRKPSEGSSSHT